MTMIDVSGADYNPFGLDELVASTSSEGQAYLEEMGAAAPGFFEVVLEGLYAPIATGFETPFESATFAYQEVNKISVGQVQLAGVSKGIGASQLITMPQVQMHLVLKYLGRQHAAEVAQQTFMHHIMRTQIVALGGFVNQLSTALTNIHKLATAYTDSRVAGERNDRVAGDANVVKLMNAVNAQTITGMETWTRQQVAQPLLKAIGDQRTQITNETTLRLQATHDKILQEVLPAIAAVTLAQAQMQPVLTKLTAESTECVQPMCDTMGPKTELGKGLSLLKGIKWLAILAALEAMDVKTLEALANTVAGTEGEIGSWVGTKILDELQGS